MSIFQLFNLPFLAYDTVFRQMDVTEQYHLSKTSSNTRRIVKSLTTRGDYYLRLCFDSWIERTLIAGKTGKVTRLEIRDLEAQQYCSNLYKPTAVEAAFKDIEYFVKVFNPEVGVHFSENCSVQIFAPFLIWLNAKIMQCSVSPRPLCNENYKLAWEICKLATSCVMFNALTYDGALTYDELPEFSDLKSFITVEHILNSFMTCKSVSFEYTDIQFDEMYPVIEKWMEGSSALKYLQICSIKEQTATREKILRDLKVKEVKNVRSWWSWDRFATGYIVKAKDGIEAVVCWRENMFELNTCIEIDVEERKVVLEHLRV